MKHFCETMTHSMCGVHLRNGNFFPASDGVKKRAGACPRCLKAFENSGIIATIKRALVEVDSVKTRLEQVLREASRIDE